MRNDFINYFYGFINRKFLVPGQITLEHHQVCNNTVVQVTGKLVFHLLLLIEEFEEQIVFLQLQLFFGRGNKLRIGQAGQLDLVAAELIQKLFYKAQRQIGGEPLLTLRPHQALVGWCKRKAAFEARAKLAHGNVRHLFVRYDKKFHQPPRCPHRQQMRAACHFPAVKVSWCIALLAIALAR